MPPSTVNNAIPPPEQVESKVHEYRAFHAGSLENRQSHYATMVNHYYDLVTDFYEFGWGQSFHFAPRFKGESLAASIARHELYLAARLGLAPGMKVLDVGCGVGGPMRALARFSGAQIVGVNNNEYQIKLGTAHNNAAHLANQCSFLKADFMALPVESASFDAVYAIEATCHAADKAALFREIARVMKPGAHFAGYEWCMTDRYRASDAEHQAIKKGIEEGDALPDIASFADVDHALTSAGLELVESRDVAPASDPEMPWYLPLSGRISVEGFKHTVVGRHLTRYFVRALETLHVAPKGSTEVADVLGIAAKALVAGGKTGIFTPMYYFHARKP